MQAAEEQRNGNGTEERQASDTDSEAESTSGDYSELRDRIGFVGAGQVRGRPDMKGKKCKTVSCVTTLPSNALLQACTTFVQMGEALIRGFIATGVSKAENISASVRSTERQQALEGLGISVYGDALQDGAASIAKNSDIIFLAVRD